MHSSSLHSLLSNGMGLGQCVLCHLGELFLSKGLHQNKIIQKHLKDKTLGLRTKLETVIHI